MVPPYVVPPGTAGTVWHGRGGSAALYTSRRFGAGPSVGMAVAWRFGLRIRPVAASVGPVGCGG